MNDMLGTVGREGDGKGENAVAHDFEPQARGCVPQGARSGMYVRVFTRTMIMLR